MPKMLADGGTEYDDGVDPTEAQQAKVRHSVHAFQASACGGMDPTAAHVHCSVLRLNCVLFNAKLDTSLQTVHEKTSAS